MRLTTIQLEMAILAIRKILPLNFPADILMRGFFRENPTLGQNDRAIIAEIVFGILRHKYFLDNLFTGHDKNQIRNRWMACDHS